MKRKLLILSFFLLSLAFYFERSTIVKAVDEFWSRSGTDTYLLNTGDNVGVGTTTPEGKMSITGDVGVGAIANTAQGSHMVDVASTKGGAGMSAIRALYPSGGGLANTEFGALAHRNSQWHAVYGKQGSASTALYTDGEVNMMNGNVGIGTTSPAYPLDMVGRARIQASNHQIYINDTNTGNDEWSITTYNDQDLAFYENGSTRRFTFTDGGTLAMGGSLDVDSISYLNGIVLNNDSDITGGDIIRGYNDLRLQGTSGTGTQVLLYSNGDVCIGNCD